MENNKLLQAEFGRHFKVSIHDSMVLFYELKGYVFDPRKFEFVCIYSSISEHRPFIWTEGDDKDCEGKRVDYFYDAGLNRIDNEPLSNKIIEKMAAHHSGKDKYIVEQNIKYILDDLYENYHRQDSHGDGGASDFLAGIQSELQCLTAAIKEGK